MAITNNNVVFDKKSSLINAIRNELQDTTL